ncbi:MAG: hypothetical protein KAQ98_12660 [Bacteriovoracaceae bacterium]|nr:hypothetical protein [Bacteriovoracaceae bacterium]
MKLTSNTIFTYIIMAFLIKLSAFCAYWDTLPKGVRTLVYRQVFVRGLEGSFDDKNQYDAYKLNLKLDSHTLHEINSATKMVFDELNRISPEAYEQFSFGEFKGEANADINASVIGLGLGVSDRMSAYFYVPYYNADVNIDFKRTVGNNHRQVVDSIENSPVRDDVSTLFAGIMNNLWDVNEGTLQSVVVNNFGYNPVGDWHAKGWGDLELGLMYRLTNWTDAGLLVAGGLVAPTGREDDPDSLHDIPFGDGQWDVFFEFGGGRRFNRLYGVDSWIRYTYQAPYKREIRLPESSSFPLTARKGEARIKRGNKIDWNLKGNIYCRDWFTVSPYYIFQLKTEDSYESEYSDADAILSEDSNLIAHSAGLTFTFSTIGFFKRKKFPLPMDIAVGALSIFAGKNTERYNRYDLEARFYF